MDPLASNAFCGERKATYRGNLYITGEKCVAKLLRLDVAQLTDVGRKRDHNEDNMAYVIPKDPTVMAQKGALFIVADGMGGHAAGEVASEIAVDTVSNAYYQDDNEDVPTSLLQAIRRANAAIQQRAAENMLRSGMGTTCVAAVLRGNMAYVANIGDSRAYLVRQSRIRQVSQDHSWVAEQVRAGLLTEDQARTHAQRNVITRSLGTQLEVEIDIFREPLEEGDTLVLCSDGLSGLVNDEELLHTVDQFVPQESVYHLVERANENGGPDNITAIVAQVQELGLEPPNMRQPVLAGGTELSDEDTARLFASKPGSINVATYNSEIPVSYANKSGPLALPDSDTAPQPAIRVKRQRGRLFYPTIVLLILFVLVAAGGGGYYFLHTSQNVASTFSSASQLLNQANGELVNHPTQALQDLATAQQQLYTLQNLDANANARLTSLQTQLVTETKTAITTYNQGAKIALLPCTNTTPNTLNANTAGAQGQTATVLQLQKDGPVLYYILGMDGNIYQLISSGNQFNQNNAFAPATPNTQITNMIGAGDKIFALSKQTIPNSSPSYALNLLHPDANNALQAMQTQNMSTSFVPDAQLLTAWDNNAYVVLMSKSNPNTAVIFSYNLDSKNNLVVAKQTSISVSNTIVGVTAFRDQLFFLLADGSVLSSQINTTDATLTNPAPVLISAPIAQPLATGAQNFTIHIPVPTAPPIAAKGSSRLIIPMLPSATNPPTLSAGTVTADNTIHLFIGDPTNHRVLDLIIQPAALSGGPDATPIASPTSNGPGSSVTLNLIQQYVSLSYFGTIRSVATDPGGTTISILSQNTQNIQSLLEVSAGPQQACAS